MTALFIIVLLILAASLFFNWVLFKRTKAYERAFRAERRAHFFDNAMAVAGIVSLFLLNRISRNLEE